MKTFPYARGRSSESNSSGDSESSAGSFFSRTRYCRRNRYQLKVKHHLKRHHDTGCYSPCWDAGLCWSQAAPIAAAVGAAPPAVWKADCGHAGPRRTRIGTPRSPGEPGPAGPDDPLLTGFLHLRKERNVIRQLNLIWLWWNLWSRENS